MADDTILMRSKISFMVLLVCGAPIILPTIENKLEAMQIFHQEMTNDINTKSHSNQLVTSLNMPMYGNISRIKLIRLVGDLH